MKFEISRGERRLEKELDQFTNAMIISNAGNNLRAFNALPFSENNYLSKTRVPSICFNYSNGRYISFSFCLSFVFHITRTYSIAVD